MKNSMTMLIHVRDDLKQKLDQQEHLTNMMQSQVDDWLKQVENSEAEVNALASTLSIIDGNNLKFYWPNFLWLYGLSKQLARQMEELSKLVDSGTSLANGMNVSEKKMSVEYIPGRSIIYQKTASKNMAKLFDLLRNDKVSTIGICGMGGVGKTTLALNLNNELGKLDSTQDFSIVIWVPVPRDVNLKQIQTRIAKRLNLAVTNEESVELISIRLHNKLLREKCFLLILDDVRKEIDIHKAGVPHPQQCIGSKIIITSRSLDVCRKMIGVPFQVNILDEEESWELFREYAGNVVEEEDIKPVAKAITQECAGLPLAITITAASMQGKTMVELWEDALRELQMFTPLVEGIKENIYMTLKWSYDLLPSEHYKSCFLFCCLYPKNHAIRVCELIRYWYCEGLLDETLSYEQVVNKGIALLQSLRDCFLLEHVKEIDSVKMHDLVRDFGIWIANSNEHGCKSLIRSGIGLTFVSNNEFLNSYKRISLMQNQIEMLPDSGVSCAETSTLFLQGNEKLEKISDSFLGAFEALKILTLNESKIDSLPSLLPLKQLCALVLRRCCSLKELPSLEGLNKLLILDCSYSGITCFPNNLNLNSLRQLDMSFSKLSTFPYRAIAKLSNLELLDMRGECLADGQILFDEVLTVLKRLTVVYVNLYSIPSNTSNWPYGRIKTYGLSIQDGVLNHALQFGKSYVNFIGLDFSQESVDWLLRGSSVWRFDACRGLYQMFKILAATYLTTLSFVNLKQLCISNIDFKSHCHYEISPAATFDLLPNLERIWCLHLLNFESISDFGQILGLRFTRLKSIVIMYCDQLKYLISLEENQTLPKLERIYVEHCEMLECLFHSPHVSSLDPILPILQNMFLCHLPNLRNLLSSHEDQDAAPKLEKITVIDCILLEETFHSPVILSNFHSVYLKNLSHSKTNCSDGESWWSKQKSDGDDTKEQFQAFLDMKKKKLSKVKHIRVPSISGQKTASKTIAQLFDLLRNDEVSRIGICGMGGVGKTTVALNLNNELGRMHLTQDFRAIIWVPVSRDANLKQIQSRIAKRLYLDIKDEDSEDIISIRLHDKLQKEKPFILILDDVWDDIALDKVGIPCMEQCPRSKLIITSRSLDVCKNMCTTIKVTVLDDDESWELFCEHAGDVVLEEDIIPLAKEITKYCDGLPLALSTIAEYMRGKPTVELWREVIAELKSSTQAVQGIKEKVYKSLKRSYDSLPNEFTKHCFLFCCLYPKNEEIKVQELVRFWYFEGLLEEDKGHLLIQSLKHHHLIECGEDIDKCVRMHPVVRDFAIWIATSIERDNCESIIRSGINSLHSSSMNELLDCYRRIYSMQNELQMFLDTMVCKNVSTSMLHPNSYSKKMQYKDTSDLIEAHWIMAPSNNQRCCEDLKILNFNNKKIRSLPCLAHYKQLRALILRKCRHLEVLPPLDGLSKLLVLDCSKSGVKQLPESLETLSSLQHLDMSLSKLEGFPYDIISKLSNLEFMDFRTIGKSFIYGERLFEEVLPFLNKLIVFRATLKTIPEQRGTVSVWPCGRIKSFGINMRGRTYIDFISRYTGSYVSLEDLDLAEKSIVWLLKEAVIWELRVCKGLFEMLRGLERETSFTKLKKLYLYDCDWNCQFQYRGSFDLLPNLEEIRFHGLDNLESISDFGNILGLHYSKLRSVNVSYSHQLKYLFFLQENQALPQLEKIKLFECAALERLFQYPDTISQQNHLPNLEKIDLYNLPVLTNINCGNDESWKNLQSLTIINCSGIKKLPLSAENADSIKEIEGEKAWWDQLQWENNHTKMLLQNKFTLCS